MKIGFITSNEGKLLELQKKMLVFDNEVIQVRIDYPEIQAESIEEVSRFGLRWVLSKFRQERSTDNSRIIDQDLDLILVEDSGLFVLGLNNFPGVYSKFVFQTIGYSGILNLLTNSSDRSARFESCFAMVDLKQLIIPAIDADFESIGIKEVVSTADIGTEPIMLFKGAASGIIVDEPRGTRGFGYDPIFQPSGSDKTFAEMDIEEKNNHSHRGKAMIKLLEFFKANK